MLVPQSNIESFWEPFEYLRGSWLLLEFEELLTVFDFTETCRTFAWRGIGLPQNDVD